MKDIFKKNKYLIYSLLYFAFYLVFFMLLEKRDTMIFNTETFIDSYIPFNEYFIVFYLFWFVYMISAFIYYIFIEKESYPRVALYLMIGMTISLTICLIIPNGIHLRPELNDDNIFQVLVSLIYKSDTSTNVFPSIHVYNSVVIAYSLNHSKLLNHNHWKIAINNIVAFMICASTVFLKQHAIIDVIAGIILAYIIIKIVNKCLYNKHFS